MTPESIVCCVRWGRYYGAGYVNALHRGARQRLRRPHRFVCITDDASGLDPGIEVIDLIRLRRGMPEERVRIGNWQKLVLYRPGALPDGATVLFLDLDTVLTGELDDLFDRVSRRRGLHLCPQMPKGERAPDRPRHLFGNASVVGFIPAEQHHIWHRLMDEGVPSGIRREQQFTCLNAAGIQHWPREWIADFKKDCTYSFPKSLFVRPKPPPDARVVIFPGSIKPTDMIRGGLYRWGSRSRFGFGDVDWVADFWRGVGDRTLMPEERTARKPGR